MTLTISFQNFQNDCPAANDRCAKTLPGIINGFEASFNFPSVKQLARVNFSPHADRLAFFSSVGNVRFEVVATFSMLFVTVHPGYNTKLQIMVTSIRYVHMGHRACTDKTNRNHVAPSKSCPAWPDPALLSNGSNEANSSLMLLRA